MTTFIDKAREDIIAIESLAPYFEANAAIICYHCQQSIEKQLKHVMSTHIEEYKAPNGYPPRTHDLNLLISRLHTHSIITPTPDILKSASELTSFEAGSRYPMDREFTEEDAISAIDDHQILTDMLQRAKLPFVQLDIAGRQNLSDKTSSLAKTHDQQKSQQQPLSTPLPEANITIDMPDVPQPTDTYDAPPTKPKAVEELEFYEEYVKPFHEQQDAQNQSSK